MLTKQSKFIIAVTIQLVIILGIIIFNLSILGSGAEVLLKIEPVDPRDPLRGDYLHFTYEISRINKFYFVYTSIKKGDIVYVPLRREGKYWRVSGFIRKEKPKDEDRVFIKGTVVYVGKNEVRVNYGIEDYFIPEGSSPGGLFWREEMAAKVAIDENGNAVLKKLYINGKPWP